MPRHLPARWAGHGFVAALAASGWILFWPTPAGADVGVPGADKLVHALVFGVLALTARIRFAGASLRPGGHIRRRAQAVFGALAAYAVLSELVQALLLSRRSGDLLDLVADLLGLAVGWRWAARVITES